MIILRFNRPNTKYLREEQTVETTEAGCAHSLEQVLQTQKMGMFLDGRPADKGLVFSQVFCRIKYGN